VALAISVSNNSINLLSTLIGIAVSVTLVVLIKTLFVDRVEMTLEGENLIFKYARIRKPIVMSIYEITDFSWGTKVRDVGTRVGIPVQNQGKVASSSCNLFFKDGSEFSFSNDEYENFEEMRNLLFDLLKEKGIIDFSRFDEIKKRDAKRKKLIRK
jgi:hypothetical protein